MKLSKNLYLRQPENEDYVKVDDFNHNSDILDTNMYQVKEEIKRKAPIDSPQFFGNPMVYNSDTKEFESIATKNDITNKLIVKEIE